MDLWGTAGVKSTISPQLFEINAAARSKSNSVQAANVSETVKHSCMQDNCITEEKIHLKVYLTLDWQFYFVQAVKRAQRGSISWVLFWWICKGRNMSGQLLHANWTQEESNERALWVDGGGDEADIITAWVGVRRKIKGKAEQVTRQEPNYCLHKRIKEQKLISRMWGNVFQRKK